METLETCPLRALARRIEKRIAQWPEWKRRAARAGLFTETR